MEVTDECLKSAASWIECFFFWIVVFNLQQISGFPSVRKLWYTTAQKELVKGHAVFAGQSTNLW